MQLAHIELANFPSLDQLVSPPVGSSRYYASTTWNTFLQYVTYDVAKPSVQFFYFKSNRVAFSLSSLSLCPSAYLIDSTTLVRSMQARAREAKDDVANLESPLSATASSMI